MVNYWTRNVFQLILGPRHNHKATKKIAEPEEAVHFIRRRKLTIQTPGTLANRILSLPLSLATADFLIA